MKRGKWGIGAALLLAVGEAMALACPGPSEFGDVAQADVFCTDASWLANRGVTLGCGGGNFCPAQNVTRGQMALFMQRLGTTLSPVSVSSSGFSQALATLPTASSPASVAEVICRTGTIAAASYPRLVVLSGWASFQVNGGSSLMRVYPAVSTDGETGWDRHGPDVFNQQLMAAATPHSFPIAAHIPLQANKSLQVGVYPRRVGGTATGLNNGECRLNLLVFSQTGGTPPYDAGMDAAEREPD